MLNVKEVLRHMSCRDKGKIKAGLKYTIAYLRADGLTDLERSLDG